MEKFNFAALGERLKTSGAQVGERLKTGGSQVGEKLKIGGAQMGRMVSGKMKEILQGQSQEAKMVDDATSEHFEEPNWGLNLRICTLLNGEELNGSEVIRAIKKKIGGKSTVSQGLSLDLLEVCAMNCDKVFSEIASEKVLDEMVRVIDNPQTHHSVRLRAIQLIHAWGENDDLGYLPVFHQTSVLAKTDNPFAQIPSVLKESLKSREVPLPPEDNEILSLSSLGLDDDQQQMTLPEGYPNPYLEQYSDHSVAERSNSLSVEERKEILIVAQNNVERLSSILNSDASQKPATDEKAVDLINKCKESQLILQGIIQNTTDDEELLFEALSIHDQLEEVLIAAKSDASRSLDSGAPKDPISSAMPEEVGVEPDTSKGGGTSEAAKDAKSVEE
ncbi:hypothetical protein QJS10_CPB18g02066 [Acorus calamus]|uniref:TOM1-like protein 2 n=1 Tax=Acorus calamus TaxID=4465 RepID=A0AAV9CN11_ACOCL|nr:hypothetical protein QJS10_CPB18g02066 [Acorus calamus]